MGEGKAVYHADGTGLKITQGANSVSLGRSEIPRLVKALSKLEAVQVTADDGPLVLSRFGQEIAVTDDEIDGLLAVIENLRKGTS